MGSRRTSSILTLSNGRHVDLRSPKAIDIDFFSIAEHLAKEPRYNGATPGRVYSVAEHSVRGAQAILEAHGGERLAGYFLLHDCHEAFLKDDTTPKKRALAAIAEAEFGVLASQIMAAFDRLTDCFDAAVHEAAGLPWPLPPEIAAEIKHWDLRMFVTEWRDLMDARGISHPEAELFADIAPLAATIIPVSWTDARRSFRQMCGELLPSLKGVSA